VQECPRADLAIAWLVSRVLRALCEAGPSAQERLRALDTAALARVLSRTTAQAEAASVDPPEYLAALGIDAPRRTAGEVWKELFERHAAADPGASEHAAALETVLDQGCLARRILRRVGEEPSRQALFRVYQDLADCLRDGQLFRVGA
jgi:hypothetical protein